MSMRLEGKAEEEAEGAVRGTCVYAVSELFHVVKVLNQTLWKSYIKKSFRDEGIVAETSELL